MIKRLAPSQITTSQVLSAGPAGTGTQLDPFYWNAVDTTNGTTSTISIGGGSMSYETITTWAKFKLTESTLYTFSHDTMPEGVTFTIYNSSDTQMAQSTLNEMDWLLAYEPSSTGIYFIKMEFTDMDMVVSASVTPVPTDMDEIIVRSQNAVGNVCMDSSGRYIPYYSAVGARIAPNPFPASTSWLALNFNGDLTDISPTGRTTITTNGTYADGKFGQGIKLLHQYVLVPYVENPFSGDFTVQAWVKALDGGRVCLCSVDQDGYFFIDNNDGFWSVFAGSGAWELLNGSVSDTSLTSNSGSGTIGSVVNTWQHIALVHYGTNWVLFVDGIESRRKVREGAISYSSLDLRIGSWVWYSGGDNLIIDDFRIDKSALWTSAFTPPSRQFS